jgi:hypothetical protein
MARQVVLGVFLLWLGLGCDRRGGTVTLPKKTVAQITSIAQLPPHRTTHVAVDTAGRVYYSVESDAGYDGVLAIDDRGLPRATQLTSAKVLVEMGESFGGTGSIHDLVGGPDGTLWFYFSGGKGRRVRACVGQFIPRLESISIIFDTKALTDLSGMGDSLALARGTLAAAGPRAWLLLRHSDAWSMFHFPNQRRARNIDFVLTCPFTKIWDVDRPIDMTRNRYELSSGADDGLLLMDRQDGNLWTLDAAGRALPRLALTGLPSELSNPLDMKDGGLMFFAAESDVYAADVGHVVRGRMPAASLPALLQIKGDNLKTIGREDLQAPGSLPVYAMRIRQLVAAPDGSWVGYDPPSGHIVRIRLTEVD